MKISTPLQVTREIHVILYAKEPSFRTGKCFCRHQLKRAASPTEEDFAQLGKCRRPHNRLGFAYQVAFVCSSIAFRSSSHSSFSRNLFTSARRSWALTQG
jgi:hypothetical protein